MNQSVPRLLWTEIRFQAREISQNRLTGLADDQTSLGWDYGNYFNADRSGWADKVKSTIPHIEEDEIYFLKKLDRNIRDVVEGGSSSQAAPEE